jgi:predicted Zn-dependent protease
VLASLGVASAQAALWACGARQRPARRRASEIHPEIRTWLRDAVATLLGAGFSAVQVLAVSRQRTTAAVDVLGAGVARARTTGVVLTARDRDGALREHVTNALSQDGIAAAVEELAPKARAASVDFGPPPRPLPVPRPDPDLLADGQILARVAALAARDRELSSRIVYSAAVMDIDDARVWSVAPGRDVEQRLVRVRRSITRVAWDGSRPIISEAARAWRGGLDDQDLADSELAAAREGALAMMTPRAFEDREYPFALDPAVTASLIEAIVQTLLTSTAARRPEVADRLAIGARAAPALVTLIDDPGVPGAYGGFQFDDTGAPANPVRLIDSGLLATRLARPRRAGHVARVEPLSSHLRLLPGAVERDQLLDEGFTLEGPLGTVVDPASDRVVIAVARARERSGGKRTGRMFADIELVGDLSSLLASVTALSNQTTVIGVRDEVGGQPRWRSFDMPWLRGRGMLRARPRAT